MAPDTRCDEEPCRSAVQALGSAKDAYNARKQDFNNVGAAVGLGAVAGGGVLVVLVAAKVAILAVPSIGWVLGSVALVLLIALGIAYYRFRNARNSLRRAKEQVRQVCPRECWPENVLKED